MSKKFTPISDDELHAYVDGSLEDRRRDEIDRLLEHDEESAAKVADYFSLNSLFHQRYDPVLDEPVPHSVLPPTRKRSLRAGNWTQFMGMAAALLLGIGIGALGMDRGSRADDMFAALSDGSMRQLSFSGEAFARQSALAHVMYAPDVMRPVEVGADKEQELAAWLSKRLGTDIQPPILTHVGFELMGARMLPGADGPIAQFMYRDAKGERMTLCISNRKLSSNTTAFKLFQDGSVNVFYWIDGAFGYSVSGALDRKVLLELAHDAYAQLTRTNEGSPENVV